MVVVTNSACYAQTDRYGHYIIWTHYTGLRAREDHGGSGLIISVYSVTIVSVLTLSEVTRLACGFAVYNLDCVATSSSSWGALGVDGRTSFKA